VPYALWAPVQEPGDPSACFFLRQLFDGVCLAGLFVHHCDGACSKIPAGRLDTFMEQILRRSAEPARLHLPLPLGDECCWCGVRRLRCRSKHQIRAGDVVALCFQRALRRAIGRSCQLVSAAIRASPSPRHKHCGQLRITIALRLCLLIGVMSNVRSLLRTALAFPRSSGLPPTASSSSAGARPIYARGASERRYDVLVSTPSTLQKPLAHSTVQSRLLLQTIIRPDRLDFSPTTDVARGYAV
jgi:hypothetical protein